MQLTLTRRSEYRIVVELFNDEGTVLYQNTISRFKGKDVAWLASVCGSSVAGATQQLNELCSVQHNGSWEPQSLEVTPPQAMVDKLTRSLASDDRVTNASIFQVTVRDITQPRTFGEAHTDPEPGEALRAAFDAPVTVTEPLIEWEDRTLLCCLDVDYHNIPIKNRPKPRQLKSILSKVKPQPFCWHASHRGGAKLYYAIRPGYLADELAAIGGLSWRRVDPRATFDLIKGTRHPCYPRARDSAPAPLVLPSEIGYCYGGGDPGELKRLLSAEMSPTETAEYLAERGWTVGQTLPHSECPIDAGQSSDETKSSVYIGDLGVFCHRCSSRGLGRGGSGFMPYASLAGGNDPQLAVMVKGFCHFDHASVVLGNLFPGIPSNILEMVYRVMLKIVHTPDDPRIALTMSSGRGFVRTRGQWVTADGTSTLAQGLKEYVRSLPSTLIPHDDGFTYNVAKGTTFLNSGSLEAHGYPDITFIRGFRIHGQHLGSRTGEHIRTIVRPEFKSCPPRYLPVTKRMSPEDSWGLLEAEYPGIDKNYVRILLATKGASEGRLAQCPFVLVTGPAGSGKSTTPHIAAGICGDKADEPIWHPHPERFRASLMDASRESSFVVVNEIFKSADQVHLSHIQALNPMLSLTEDSRSHVLYIGSVPFGRLPVFVLTDVNVPREVETDVQIARRFIYYRLTQRIHWDATFVTKGIRPHEFRLLSLEHALAADSILSDLIDEFFQEPMSLRDIAAALGSQPLESYSDDSDRKLSLMAEFFKEVCQAPLLVGSDAGRYSPVRGWKRIDRIGSNRLNDLWAELADGSAPERWQTSRTCDAEDWAKILGIGFPVICDIRPYQTSCVYVRFRSADDPKKPAWINGKKVTY